MLSGTVSLRAGDQTWREVGERGSVFEQRSPYALYVPARSSATVVARSPGEIGVASAPGTSGRPARLIEPGAMRRFARGEGLNQRFVCDILPESEPADHLLVVEVLTPSGHSSSYPPHKHDTDNLPQESSLEETYYHRLNPAQGFAFQRVYTDDRSLDESHAAEDHDVMVVPRGYHPVGGEALSTANDAAAQSAVPEITPVQLAARIARGDDFDLIDVKGLFGPLG